MHTDQVIAAVRFDPLLPVWLLVSLGVLCAAVVALGLWRRAGGTTLRLAAFAVLLLWLTGPRLVQETRESLHDIGLLVVDQSASMQVGDRAALADKARQSIEAQAARDKNLELRTITVPEAGNAGTRLFAAIDRALADIPRARLAGTIAITDGQLHDVPATAPGDGPVRLVYLLKQGTFYPFAPSGPHQRDNELELRVKSFLSDDLAMEKDLSRWMALWDLPVR